MYLSFSLLFFHFDMMCCQRFAPAVSIARLRKPGHLREMQGPSSTLRRSITISKLAYSLLVGDLARTLYSS